MSTLSRPLLLSLVLAAACAHTQNAGLGETEESDAGTAVDAAPAEASGPTAAADSSSEDRPATGSDAAASPAPSDFAWNPAAGALELDDVVRGGSSLATEAAAGWETRRLVGGAEDAGSLHGHAHDHHLARGALEAAVPESAPMAEHDGVYADERAAALLGALGTRGEAEPPAGAPAEDGYAGEGMRAEAEEGAVGTADAMGVIGFKSGSAAEDIGGLGAKGRGRGGGGSGYGMGTLSRGTAAKAKPGRAAGAQQRPFAARPCGPVPPTTTRPSAPLSPTWTACTPAATSRDGQTSLM